VVGAEFFAHDGKERVVDRSRNISDLDQTRVEPSACASTSDELYPPFATLSDEVDFIVAIIDGIDNDVWLELKDLITRFGSEKLDTFDDFNLGINFPTTFL
tara:strand:- start:2173 stop:2475 length:303 start_codon:yes stop_codon:yes gene_type:complete